MTLSKTLLLLALTFVAPLSFAETPAENSALSGKEIALSLPINATVAPPVTLFIKIPKGFRALQSLTDLARGKSNLIEFIPKDDGEYDWTEIITLNPFIGAKMKASDIVNSMNARFKQAAQEVHILETKTTQHGNYEQSCTAMDYVVNKRHEMVYMCYYSGPYDCAGIQYTLLWPKNSKLSKSQMLNKLKRFVGDSSRVG